MRRLITYLTALILAVSCVAELEPGGMAVGGSLEGAPVTITFSVPDIPVLPATKTLETGDGDITGTPYLDPDKMYLVVCGSSQSIKYIRKATLVSTQDNVEIPQEHFPLSEGDRVTTLYTFSVQLELSDQARTIHILGNVDENQLITGSYSYQSLPNMLSYDNKQAYWQKLYVPHIRAKKDPVTQEPIKLTNGSYQPDDETSAYFQYVPLIRNFAKIQVTNASENFTLHSYAVIFYPERGSVVPYRSNEPVKENRFDFKVNPPANYLLSGYERSTFDNLESDIDYLGNMPAGVALSEDIPKASEFEEPSTSMNGRVLEYNPSDTEKGFYIYERGIPNDKVGPTFIILCGKFEEDDTYYYYRLDLMESKVEGNQTVSRYYPIYRNFRYNIQLHRISSEGVLNPEAAVNSSGTDISADFSMRHLSDISNGTTRLVVEPFMTRTCSSPAEEGTYYELYARFFDNVNSDVPNMNTAAVRVELEPMTDGSDDILILYDDNEHRVPTKGFFFPEPATVGGVEGIRIIRFNIVEPLAETKTQKIKITGHNPGNPQELRLYREVEITLQQKQPLTVTCTDPVQTSTGSPVTVDISIPSELPESMFPLKFIVEPEAGTLTPDTSKGINMPVVSGRSIATTETAFTNTPAFYYIRTLTREEFLQLPVVNGNERTFNCYFKTNRDFNATTIWVYNEYFAKGSASFLNKLPLTLTCTDPVLATAGTQITLALTVHSQIPESYFPLDFIVEPEALTMISLNNDIPLGTGPSIATDQATFKDTNASRFTRTLTWEEYSNLPVSGNERTFYCYFKSIVDQSATTIWAYNERFYKANVSFQNVAVEPDNHFYVIAVEDCTITIRNNNTKDIKYKIDDGGWINYTSAGISLTSGQKASIKAGSNSSKKTWSAGSASISGTGGKFKVGGNFASLIVGDDYPDHGASIDTGTFIDFFKAQTLLVDAYDLELPMTKLAANAYKSMFDSCTSLEHGPQVLPATTLGETCYRNMFYNCSSLVSAPVLAATKLSKGAYQRMFYGCGLLSSITMLGTQNYRDDAFFSDGTNWCGGISATGELWLDSSLNPVTNYTTSWNKIVPAGWTVKYVGIDDQ
ncbi:MAG: hypothetical protein J6W82_04880 [Bacteroidales bacterium]|nr:hypothetical protein [Bacteroidales bacterium]